MVMLRSSSGAAEAAAPKRAPSDMDSSSEFLSLRRPQRKSARLRRGLDDSCSSAENSPANGYLSAKEENSEDKGSMRTRAQRDKPSVKFADMRNQTDRSAQKEDKRSQKEDKRSSPKEDKRSPQKEEEIVRHLRKSPRFQTDGDKSGDENTVVDEIDRTPTTQNLRARLREEKEDSAVRRSSRITRYKLDARNQSVLYDRLITNTAEAVLQKMDDMQKMRRRLRSRDSQEENHRMYSEAKRKRTTQSSVRTDEESADDQENEYSDQEDDNDDNEDDEDEEDGEGEEEEEDNQKRYEFRQRKAVVRYQAPLEEPRKQSIFFRRHSTPIRQRYSFGATGPHSPYNRRRSSRRRHAIHSSDSTSSSSSSDDEKFERRRNKSRNRSMYRCLPMNLLKEDLLGIHKDRIKIGASLADVDPMQIDQTVRFDSIGGLGRHISALKEMVVFPLLYPEVFERFKIQPPRGCLFYGPPGTGKTLVARALANECSQGDKKVAFFMRKGADCLSKWVGESERQLRLLFDQAYQMRPSIIFFDEIDGIAPVRSSRQDQIHSSIVSTLLALMDGLDSRGEVVVIGATNRLDSIDPALRRPGRFDREFLFSLPDREARKDILKIHTRQWNPQPSDAFLEELADKCVGYCGADIKAICAEAALCALRRRYPQIYASSQKLLLDVASISVDGRDFLSAMRKIVPASQRAVASPARALTPVVQPLLANTLISSLKALQKLFPHVEQGLKKKKENDGAAGVLDDLLHSDDEGSSMCTSNPAQKNAGPAGTFLHFNRSALQQPTSFRPRLLLSGGPGSGQSTHLAPAILHTLEKFPVYTLDMAVLFGVSTTSPEEACAQLFCEAKRTAPSILYIPHMQRWWDTVSSALRATFLSLLQDIPSFSPILLLATCSFPYQELCSEVQDLFLVEYGEVFNVPLPCEEERRKFFEDLILVQAAKAPVSKREAVLQALEVLPVAPPPPPRQLSGQEQQKLEEQEEDTLRELRLFLRDVTNRLAQDKRFKIFTKPVDTEEVPDYTTVIKQPMDLSTVLSKIDLHKYVTVKDFLHDVDLIWKNALEYNPDRDPSDRLIRHRACALKDTVHAIIKDELDEDFEKICVEIKESHMKRGCTTSRFTPSYYHVLPKVSTLAEPNDSGPSKDAAPVVATPVTPKQAGVQKKKKRRKLWSNGLVRRKKSSHSHSKETAESGEEEEDEDEDEDDGKAAESEGADEKVKDVESEPMEVENKEEDPPPTENRNETIPPLVQNGNVSSGEGDDVSMVSSANGIQNGNVSDAIPNGCSAAEDGDNSEVQLMESTDAKRVKPSAEEDTGIEKGMRRMTRGLRMQAQQQQLLDVDTAMRILEQGNQPLIVDHNKLKELLQKVVAKTEGYEVDRLEKLYALLCQSIYRHKRDYDKTALIQEMSKQVEDFS
ncbi:ATPase family AAA domain-containing protein 2-like isoform X1 [Colossoma macropomum]|uniref:ATPase family AAA domain-containing protein 2-like isoform X1 n=2 Tax=Colossoma macropomum TaxID=42526 RepID=UPI0018653B8F|nr:ATPase family AAA domain-containing protein 2-like isoform X1 [Colossoma macropomum]